MKLPLINRSDTVREALVERATQQAESGRRLAMYDRASGLYAYWYFVRRFEEEARRADRYARPLAAILVEVKRHEAYKTEDQVTAWLEQELRATDLASHLGDGRYMAMLTETSANEAEAIVSRLSGRFPQALAIGIGCYPQDGKSLDEVQKAAELRADGHWALCS